MTRCSVSNLAFPDVPVRHIAPLLKNAGVSGVEIAPTVIWGTNLTGVSPRHVVEQTVLWSAHGIHVSAVQSLLFGRPDLQLFDRDTWPAMRDHLRTVLDIASGLGTSIAVFGSPKNRIKGDLSTADAHSIAAEFLSSLLPDLYAADVVLTLEPNAPQYGADYLTTYADVVTLATLVNSPWVRPQIDTGCLIMAGDDPVAAARLHRPTHVHVSVPNLHGYGGPTDHKALSAALTDSGYDGWITLEMLPAATGDPTQHVINGATWLAQTYGATK